MSRPEPWSHDALQRDLAKARTAAGEVVAEKLGLGLYATGGQIDVAALKPSWTQPNPTAYEVKVSRSDFLADSQAGKFLRYLPYVRRLYFATPAGLLDKREIPDGAGLIVRSDNGWHVLRAARPHDVDPKKHAELLQAMLLKPLPATWKDRIESRPDRIARALEEKDLLRVRRQGIELSERIRRALLDAEMAVRDRDACRSALANELGEPAGDRSLVDLAMAILKRAPVTKADTKGLRWPLEATVRQAQAALDALNRLEGRATLEASA